MPLGNTTTTNNTAHVKPKTQTPTPSTSPALPFHLSSSRDMNFFGMDSTDDIVRVVSDFLFEYTKDRSHVEIEAKLGEIRYKGTDQRIQLGVMTETVLLPEVMSSSYRFVADMAPEQHKYLNNVLNKRCEETKAAGFRGEKIKDNHTYETDRFYQTSAGKVRVTSNQKTGELIGIVDKRRVADLDVHSPRNPFDFRISVNTETPLGETLPLGLCQYERNKNRMSYKHQIFKIDLTQVNGGGSGSGQGSAPTSHELEIEFLDPKKFVDERDKANAGLPNNFLELTRAFVNNIRTLAKIGRR